MSSPRKEMKNKSSECAHVVEAHQLCDFVTFSRLNEIGPRFLFSVFQKNDCSETISSSMNTIVVE